MKFDYPIQVPITVLYEDQLRAIYAVLANPNIADAVNLGLEFARQKPAYKPNTGDHRETVETDPVMPEVVGNAASGGAPDGPNISSDKDSEVEVDSAGVPFDPEIHTGTKIKDGLWRMKKGCERPNAPVNEDTEEVSEPSTNGGETESNTTSSTATNTASPSDDEDEFAAFTKAAAEAEAAEPAEVPARTWTDADLSALCNAAVSKLGGEAGVGPVKGVIAKFSPEGEVPHSRHIPADQRESFAQAIEELAGIEFAG